eukprot:s276_g16.t1
MQMILLMSVICAASGFTLEMPELPDLIATVGKVFRGNFTLKMVEEPDVFLPKVSQIETMTREERMDRFHWFFCVYVLIFLGVTLLGSVIMIVGPILKSKASASSDDSDSEESSELLSSEDSDSSVSSYEALGPTFTALSMRTQQCLVILSVGVTMSLSLVASLWSLKTGRLSKVTGLDWEIYLILFCCVALSLLVQAVWAVARLKPGDRFDSTAFAVAAFTSMAPIISDFYDTLKDVIFGALCLQSEHRMIQILGVVSWLYLCLFHAWFLLVGVLGKKLNRAMRNGDMVTAFLLWEEAELDSDNLQLFGLILPRLTFFLETLSRHGFNRDPTELNEEELTMVQRIGQDAVYLGQSETYRCGNRGELGTKVVAEAMATNSVIDRLNLNGNNIGDAGAQALAESLKINLSLKELDLRDNNIGAAGAQALAEALKINATLRYLYLQDNNIGVAGAQALAAGLLQNRGLQGLLLSPGSRDQALEDAEKTKTDRGEDFQIWLRYDGGGHTAAGSHLMVVASQVSQYMETVQDGLPRLSGMCRDSTIPRVPTHARGSAYFSWSPGMLLGTPVEMSAVWVRADHRR